MVTGGIHGAVAFFVTGVFVAEVLDGEVVVQACEVLANTEFGTEKGSVIQHSLGLQVQVVAGRCTQDERSCNQNVFVCFHDSVLH